MPEEIEKKLKEEADKLGLTGDRRKAYIYGTLNKIEDNKENKEHFWFKKIGKKK